MPYSLFPIAFVRPEIRAASSQGVCTPGGELFFGDASRADSPPAGCGSQGNRKGRLSQGAGVEFHGADKEKPPVRGGFDGFLYVSGEPNHYIFMVIGSLSLKLTASRLAK
jgi:hypothetical protein